MADVTPMLAQLAPAVLLIVAALLALRRWLRPDRRAPGALRVVARTGLTKSSVVSVVDVGDRRFLLGAGDHGVQLLTELAPDTARAGARERTAAGAAAGMDPAHPRPRTGLVDRLRDRTVRLPAGHAGHAPPR